MPNQLQRISIAPSQLQNQEVILTVTQEHYLCRVLRLERGDLFVVMDGCGNWWLVSLQEKLPGQPIKASILEPILVENELPFQVILLAALPKGNGFDEVVRQVTELGVSEIIPVKSDRTLLNPSTTKLERWRRIAAEAAEQSERQIIPQIWEPISFLESLTLVNSNYGNNSDKYICVTREKCPNLLDCLGDKKNINQTNLPAIIIGIGPEGGWSLAEIESAYQNGFKPVSLGKRILRAVTAPLVALSLISTVYESKLLVS